LAIGAAALYHQKKFRRTKFPQLFIFGNDGSKKHKIIFRAEKIGIHKNSDNLFHSLMSLAKQQISAKDFISRRSVFFVLHWIGIT